MPPRPLLRVGQALLALALCSLSGCAGLRALTSGPESEIQPLPPYDPPDEPGDPPAREPGPPLLIENATVLTGTGQTLKPGWVLLEEGRISGVGQGDAPERPGVARLDAKGRFVTPGIIDVHSHMGVYPYPHAEAHADGNEASSPNTAHVWAEHGFWPQDPALWRALAGGVTTIQVLPGSANLIGGRSLVAKLRPGASARQMRVRGAPQGLKLACGENPKRVHGSKGAPRTRMGNVAGFREAFQKALEYRRALQKYERELLAYREQQGKGVQKTGSRLDHPPEPPPRDLSLETLVKVLEGRILVHAHCYRADEMLLMLDLAREFGFRIRAFHHALEAYKIAPRLKEEGVTTASWVDWWGFKLESFDGIPQNVAVVTAHGGKAVLHSDSGREVRRLNQEAGKALGAARQAKIPVTEEDALSWITANAAWVLGLEGRLGTLEPGKDADLVVWSAHPLSVYAVAEQVFIEGERVFDRTQGPRVSDFELGFVDAEATAGEEGSR